MAKGGNRMSISTDKVLLDILGELKAINKKLYDIKNDTGDIESNTSGNESEVQRIRMAIENIDNKIEAETE